MQWSNRKELSALLSSALSSKHSSFYREKYKSAGVRLDTISPKNLIDLPLLSRAELVEAPLTERIFVSPEYVRFVAFTSGTSSKQPLMMPFADVKNYYFEPSLGTGVSRPLVVHPPLMKSFGHTFMQQCREAVHPLNPLFGDVQNLANSALVAASVGCDSIYSIPTVAALFGPLAAERGIAKDIRLVALSSETLTGARRAELARLYPNALVANLYGSTELGQLPFFPCPRMMEEGLSRFHVLTSALAAVEIIDGELVVSYGLNPAAPLIRYRTGDHFEEVAGGCSCGKEGPVLQWSHRKDVDRLRINGVEFTIEEADRAFSRLSHIERPEYQIHFRSVPGESGNAVAILVEVVHPVIAKDLGRSLAMAIAIKKELPALWRISSTATLEDALTRGFFSSLSVSIVPEISDKGLKARRFIDHVE